MSRKVAVSAYLCLCVCWCPAGLAWSGSPCLQPRQTGAGRQQLRQRQNRAEDCDWWVPAPGPLSLVSPESRERTEQPWIVKNDVSPARAARAAGQVTLTLLEAARWLCQESETYYSLPLPSSSRHYLRCFFDISFYNFMTNLPFFYKPWLVSWMLVKSRRLGALGAVIKVFVAPQSHCLMSRVLH